MRRYAYILLISVLLLLIYAGLNLTTSISNRDSEPGEGPSIEFDAYAEGTRTSLFNELGQIEYLLLANKQIHYLNETTVLEYPEISLYEGGNSNWYIVANSGRISTNPDGGQTSVQTIEFNGSVKVSGTDSYGNATLFNTEQLFIDPELETLQTDLPVSMVSEGIILYSTGMFADLPQDKILFHNNVRGYYADADTQ